MKSNKWDVSVIIPFLNEEENIDELLNILDNTFKKIKKRFQVVFVDDGSTDDSVDIIKKTKDKCFSIKLIKLSKNFGSHSAIRSGILHSDGDYITFLAADLQEDPKNVIDFHASCVSNKYDVLIIIRETFANSFSEKMFSLFYSWVIKVFVSKDYPNKNISNFMISRKVQTQLNKNIASNTSILLQIYNMGFKKGYVTYTQSNRKSGKSKWTFSKKLKLFIDSIVSFSYVPLRMISISGAIFFFLGFVYIIFVLISHFVFKNIQYGWPTLISIILMGFGLTNVSLGIISEYLWRIYDNSKNTAAFIIDEIYDIN